MSKKIRIELDEDLARRVREAAPCWAASGGSTAIIQELTRALDAQLAPQPRVGDVKVKDKGAWVRFDNSPNPWFGLAGGQFANDLEVRNYPTVFNILNHLTALEAGACAYLTKYDLVVISQALEHENLTTATAYKTIKAAEDEYKNRKQSPADTET